jgi:BirA family biotin operon repressor/biotin-[acetyl-CoA-carboxylase] ligase
MPFGDIVHRLEAVVSTNDFARALALAGATHGTAVLARSQSRGRGTKGRAWHSAAGLGLYTSFILRGPDDGSIPHPQLVPLAAGLAVSDAVRETTGLETRLKWPNDVLFEGKKLGGILSEGVGAGAPGGFVVLGIGLNVGHAAEDLPEPLRGGATSLRLAGGRPVTVEALWSALCGTLERWYNVLTRGDKEAVVRTFEERAAFPRGAAVRVETPGQVFEAAYQGLDPEGRLVVKRAGAPPIALDSVLRLERIS